MLVQMGRHSLQLVTQQQIVPTWRFTNLHCAVGGTFDI
jgi:hypothetical protein